MKMRYFIIFFIFVFSFSYDIQADMDRNIPVLGHSYFNFYVDKSGDFGSISDNLIIYENDILRLDNKYYKLLSLSDSHYYIGSFQPAVNITDFREPYDYFVEYYYGNPRHVYFFYDTIKSYCDPLPKRWCSSSPASYLREETFKLYNIQNVSNLLAECSDDENFDKNTNKCVKCKQDEYFSLSLGKCVKNDNCEIIDNKENRLKCICSKSNSVFDSIDEVTSISNNGSSQNECFVKCSNGDTYSFSDMDICYIDDIVYKKR